jgi:transforming acidic coiled-coil-containing protein 3
VKIDDIEKKLKDAELREEALLKRITEKDKTISKMRLVSGSKCLLFILLIISFCSGVVEAYEKAIAELIAEKESITQQCEKKYTTLLANSEVNEKHLDSLEKTFSDLHA